MMKTAFRIAWLFVAYGAIGYGGDWAVGLLAQESPAPAPIADAAVVADVDVRPEVVVRVRPEVVTRVVVRHGDECTYETRREVSVPASSEGLLRVSAGSGELHVEGRPDLDEVVVVGRLCASDEAYLDEMDVRVERSSAGEVLVDTDYPEDRRWSDGGRNVARIDLTVLVPRGMDARIDDSSGEMVVSGTGALTIDDSSGSIEAFDIVGPVRIDDSSGGIDLRDVTGDVDIDDGSGGLDVARVGGSLTLRDGSGGIDATSIDGDVHVRSDGSGSISVRDVGGDFVVDRDGSGGIRHSGVEGRVDIPRKR
jgi:hypothetical protein